VPEIDNIDTFNSQSIEHDGCGACLAVSYLLALLSWNVFEKHFLRLKKYFPYQISSPHPSALKNEVPAEVPMAD
jgi:peptidoglycan/LPS O-acetylase OafA/YrhL